ncbi:glycerol transporter [Microbotryomycetes sp. JL201]|nr:glycerol transporter [Microbotryomycetes sp. JL201]
MSNPPSPTPRRQDPFNTSRTGLWRRVNLTNLTVHIPQHDATAKNGHQTLNGRTHQGGNSASGQHDSTGKALPEPRWHTREFRVYYAIFAIAVPAMVRAATQLSRIKHPTYFLYAHRLAPGWLFGWQVDQSDDQWYTVRSHLPMLAALVVLWVTLSSVFNFVVRPPQQQSPSAAQIPPRARFILAFGLVLLTVLHGTSMPKMLAILWLNYRIARIATWGGNWTRATPVLTWIFNLAILFSNEIYEGYHWSSIGLTMLDDERWHGILPRWHINWNITMLRLISFNMDYYWATSSHPPPPPPLDASADIIKDEKSPPAASVRSSPSSTSHPLHFYAFWLYLTYALYPPLYLAGPILTFNSFVSQLLNPPVISRRMVASYFARFLACLLTMELVTHSMYVVAIKDESRAGSGAWDGATPFQLSMVGFWNLIIVWLKLLIPWRFFRLWAFLDGIDPPENMVRCMANNYSTMGFWRSWHRSFNLWTVRYLYIPLGGSSRALLSTLTVFTFVALWHDLSLKLLTWGWVITLFVIPEMVAKKVLPYDKYGSTCWYRHVAAFGGVLNVLMMMTGNLIGFAIGTDGMKYMWQQMIGTWAGVRFMIVAMACLFVAVQVMFEYR